MGRRLPISLSSSDVKRLLDQIDHNTPTGLRNRTSIELMLRCGLRVGEVSALRRQDVDWDAGPTGESQIMVRSGKGDKDRVVAADAGTMTWLRRWDHERNGHATSFFHTLKQGRTRPFSVRGLQMAVKKYVHRADLDADPADVTPHTLRHTYATQLLDEHFTIREVQELLGHERIETTERYTHVSNGNLRRKIGERKPVDGQRNLEAQPDAVELRVGRLLVGLAVDEKEALGQELLAQVAQERELVGVE